MKHSLVLGFLVFTLLAAPLCGQDPASAKEQVAKLVAILKSDASQKDKADACRQLAILGTPEVVPVLASLLGDEKLGHMARYGLEPIQHPSVDEALRKAMGQLKGRPLVGVIGSLGVRHDTKAIPALAKMLKSSDGDVAQAAARSLGNIGSAGAAKALTAALAEAPKGKQLALCEGLFRCAENLKTKGKQAEALGIYDRLRDLKTAHQVRAGALRGAILLRGQEGLPLLKQHLCGEDYAMFGAALRIAQELRSPEAAKVLVGELPQLPANRQIPLIQTLVTTYIDEAATRKLAGQAVIEVAEKLLKAQDSQTAARLVEPLQRIAQNGANPDLQKRAQAALGEAQSQAKKK